MTKEREKEAKQATVRARVLLDCDLGKCNDIVVIDVENVKALHGIVDADPASVAYAQSLK